MGFWWHPKHIQSVNKRILQTNIVTMAFIYAQYSINARNTHTTHKIYYLSYSYSTSFIGWLAVRCPKETASWQRAREREKETEKQQAESEQYDSDPKSVWITKSDMIHWFPEILTRSLIHIYTFSTDIRAISVWQKPQTSSTNIYYIQIESYAKHIRSNGIDHHFPITPSLSHNLGYPIPYLAVSVHFHLTHP